MTTNQSINTIQQHQQQQQQQQQHCQHNQYCHLSLIIPTHTSLSWFRIKRHLIIIILHYIYLPLLIKNDLMYVTPPNPTTATTNKLLETPGSNKSTSTSTSLFFILIELLIILYMIESLTIIY